MSDERERQEAEFIATLETEGPEAVRLRLGAHGYTRGERVAVLRWLATKDQERADQGRVIHTRRTRDARRARLRGAAAAAGAIFAVIAAMVGVVIYYVVSVHSRP